MAASGIEEAFRMLEGRWKMVIIFHLFDLAVTLDGLDADEEQLRDLERDGIVTRTIHPQVPPKVDELTSWGQAMCPALDALLEWAAQRPLRQS